MSGLTKLGFALVLVFSLSLLGLAAELLYLLHCRRRRRLRSRSASDPELAAPSDGPTHRELLLHVLCFKPRSRVEPATCAAASAARPKSTATAAAEPPEEEEWDLARWRTVCLGPSRALFTIDEEPEEEEERGSEAEETPFATPCASLRFDTPSSSPPREGAIEVTEGPSLSDRQSTGSRDSEESHR
ncbi:hypothetical protein Cni_G21505 [Canna indica]|uniref:Uncharacterized protein n=1 Tax=Canna indica TaxID=4628 RepID=A0AAQ3KPM4_9LILI|nr:hypothetical protein Cni_G21505 [Canna indica]